MAGIPENEQHYLQQAQRGDLDAFNALVLYYQNSVYTLAYRIMGEEESAADAAQEAFIVAYRRIATYRGGSFRGWLLRIATNLCYDELRRRKRRPAASLQALEDADDGASFDLPSPELSPEQVVQQSELNTAIQNCINGLNDEQRVVLVLSDVQGLSYQEISEQINVQLGTVKSRLSRARLGIRRCLQAVQELLPSEYRLLTNED